MIMLLKRSKRACALGLGLLLLLAAGQVMAQQGRLFDHANTGFELSGGHKFAACESCHVNGQFAGTPRQCVDCHSINGRFNATPKPIEHIYTSEQCDACHTVAVWNAVPRVDHAEVFGTCVGCHNNNIASGKPIDHIRASDDCESCHSGVLSWLPVSASQVDHDAIPNVDDCFSCHNDFIAPGKMQHPDHIDVLNDCGGCHTNFNAWAPVPASSVDHSLINNVDNCISCHVEDRAAAVNHPDTTINCGACHTTTSPFASILPSQVDHAEIPAAQMNMCATCHEQDRPAVIQLPSGTVQHPLDGECGVCHTNTDYWSSSSVQM